MVGKKLIRQSLGHWATKEVNSNVMETVYMCVIACVSHSQTDIYLDINLLYPTLFVLNWHPSAALGRWAQNHQSDGCLTSFHGRALHCSHVQCPVRPHSPLITLPFPTALSIISVSLCSPIFIKCITPSDRFFI